MGLSIFFVFENRLSGNTLYRMQGSFPTSIPAREKGIIVFFRVADSRRSDQADQVELQLLCESCAVAVLASLRYTLNKPNPATLIGRGKVEELSQIKESSGCDLFVFSREISPAQKRNLEQALACKVIGKTELILDIFARRARTRVARLQVELAQLEYTLPRLTGMWQHLAGSQGGVGFRGPGEKQLELDRRTVKQRISHIKKRLSRIKKSRGEQRKRRLDKPTVVIVGYTNAGKSTLLNALARDNVPAADMPFASLDSTIREVYNPDGPNFLFIDTVGFIKDLPHNLIEAFKTTLEEIGYADMILLLADVSDETVEEKIQAVHRVLDEIGVQHKPLLYCFNKVDNQEEILPALLRERYQPNVAISALHKNGLDTLLEEISNLLDSSRPSAEATGSGSN